jgi:Na+/H+ antiporter NhaA/protein-disulfide isomerase
VPAGLYLVLNNDGEAARGWGVVIGTDTAFLLAVLALVGPAVSTQLRVFLLTLTVIDDIVAVAVIGIAYTGQVQVLPLVVAVLALASIGALGWQGVWRAAPYVAFVGIAWLATVGSGLHASIAGMIAGLLIPAAAPTRASVEAAALQFRMFRQSPLPGLQRRTRARLTRSISVNERFQESIHGVTSYLVVPIFAFVSAGVDLRGGVLADALRSPVTWGVVLGLVVGKTVGTAGGVFAAQRLKLGRLPEGVGGGHVLGGAALSGIGFTVALLIVDLAFDSEQLRREAIVGVLLSVIIASLLGRLVFALAARFFGQDDAALPTLLSRAVDPARDHVQGPADAAVTLVEYLDFECPFCAKATGSARQVREHFGDRLRYVVRNLPLEVHPNSLMAAVAAEAAGRQDRYWEMHDQLFAHQDQLQVEHLVGYAKAIGLDVDEFLRDVQDDELVRRVAEDKATAWESGARGTPTFFVGDRRHEGPYDAASLIGALEALVEMQPGGGTRSGRGRTPRVPQL